jgi:hypothetical protein
LVHPDSAAEPLPAGSARHSQAPLGSQTQLAISASQPSPVSYKHDVCHVTLDCRPVIALTQAVIAIGNSGKAVRLPANTPRINTLYDALKTAFSTVKYFSARMNTGFATVNQDDLMICQSAFSREFGAMQLNR